MSGIFPESGVTPAQAVNSIINPATTDGCPPLYYSSNRCMPRFDPAAANAVISELINAVNGAGLDYDCGRLDNLLRAIKAIAFAPGSLFTFDIPGAGSIVVPNDKSYAEVELIGGGGAGGSVLTGAVAAGGNGGDLVRGFIPVIPGNTIAFVVGAGGIAQTAPTPGQDGSDSILGAFIAKGGHGAPAGTTSGGNASPPSTGSVGDYVVSGQLGEYGLALNSGDLIGGRGGSSGNGTQGGNGSVNGGTAANPGQQPGGGGGGGSAGSGGFSAGGRGANGRITLTFY